MEILYNILLVVVGVLLLTKGADWLVSGSSGIARRFGVSSMIVGLTLVAFGTSAPELAASMASAIHGKGDIAFGNVVGSNICNIGLILGAAAFLRPIGVNYKTIRWEIPFMIGISLLIYAFAFNLFINRLMGIVLIGLFGVFLLYCAKNAKDDKPQTPHVERSLPRLILLIIAGGVGLVFGAEIFLKGAINIAKIFGVSEAVISLTLVALGTSLPELSASLVASWKKESSIALGNVIGSNIFNILLVAGATASVSPFKISRNFLYIGLPVMVILSVLLVPMALTRKRIGRKEGVFLLAFYFAYITWLYVTKD